METGLAVVGVVSMLVGLVTGGHQMYVVLRARAARVPNRISWRRIEKSVNSLVEQMRREGFVPDLIIGIGRSGAIVGGLVAGNMGNIPLALLDRKNRWDEHQRQTVQSEFTSVQVGPSCKRVLLVIGEVYSGQSMVECLRHIDAVVAHCEVKTATIVQSRNTTYVCDYHALLVERPVTPAWVFSPEYVRYQDPKTRIRDRVA